MYIHNTYVDMEGSFEYIVIYFMRTNSVAIVVKAKPNLRFRSKIINLQGKIMSSLDSMEYTLFTYVRFNDSVDTTLLYLQPRNSEKNCKPHRSVQNQPHYDLATTLQVQISKRLTSFPVRVDTGLHKITIFTKSALLYLSFQLCAMW